LATGGILFVTSDEVSGVFARGHDGLVVDSNAGCAGAAATWRMAMNDCGIVDMLEGSS
jgi:hypothetical protein